MTKYTPGEKVRRSGIYTEYSSDGKFQAEITCVKNESFPPSLTKGNYYQLARSAKHRISEGNLNSRGHNDRPIKH